jgi:methylase of polypeptide subunit release factors
LQEADRAATAHQFFHWELEFPEVFFDRHGQAGGSEGGFDAVISNPPYVRQEELAPFKPSFASANLETYDGVADLYTSFYQQGLRLTRAGGRMASIVTNTWMRALQAGYADQLAPLQQSRTEAETLERQLSELVNAAYSLTPEEIALLWETALSRMPLKS